MNTSAADQSTSVDLALAVSGASLTPWQVHNLHLFLQAFGADAALRYLEDLTLAHLISEHMRAELSKLGRVA